MLTFVCAVAALVLGWTMGESALPGLVYTTVLGKVELDSQAKVEDTMHKWSTMRTEITFFNLTNGFDLLTTTPAPKPTFSRRVVSFTRRSIQFDGVSDATGSSYGYKELTYFVPDDASDLEMEIVQVNPAYLGAIFASAPAESTLYLGLAHIGLQKVQAALSGYAAALLNESSAPTLITAVATMLSVPASDLQTQTQVVLSQFGTGAFSAVYTSLISQGTFSSASIFDVQEARALGVCTTIEVYAYLNATDGPLKSGALPLMAAAMNYTLSSFTMTQQEANSFLSLFSAADLPTPYPSIAPLPNVVALLAVRLKAWQAAPIDPVTISALVGPKSPFTTTYGALVALDAGGIEVQFCNVSGEVYIGCPLLAAA